MNITHINSKNSIENSLITERSSRTNLEITYKIKLWIIWGDEEIVQYLGDRDLIMRFLIILSNSSSQYEYNIIFGVKDSAQFSWNYGFVLIRTKNVLLSTLHQAKRIVCPQSPLEENKAKFISLLFDCLFSR